MATYEALKDYLFELYENQRREGNTYDDALAIVAGMASECFKPKKSSHRHDVTDKYRNLELSAEELFEKEQEKIVKFADELSAQEFKQALNEIISKWEEKAPRDKRRTAPDVIKLMRSFAENLLPEGPYSDIAVGSGGIIEDFNKLNYFQDIDHRLLIVADAFWNLSIYKREIPGYTASNKDSITNIGQKEGVIIFDPPMGDLRERPTEWDEKQVNKILGPASKGSKTSSEVLFLANVLLNAYNDSYFIGLFPPTFLTKNNKELNTLRGYLINNSLKAVIKAYSGHVLLIGQKKLDVKQYSEIPVISIEKELKEAELKQLTQECLKDKGYNFEAIKYREEKSTQYDEPRESGSIEVHSKMEITRKVSLLNYTIYKRESFKGDKTNIIQLPIGAIEKKDHDKPVELINQLETLENEITTAITELKGKILAIPDLNDEEDKEEQKPLWFIDKEEENKASKQLKEEINALRFFYNFDAMFVNHSNLEEYIAFSFARKVSAEKMQECLRHLKCLFDANRLKIENSELFIRCKRHTRAKTKEPENDKYFDLLKPDKFEERINLALATVLDQDQRTIYEDLCRYWLIQEEDLSILKDDNTKISRASVDLALKVLTELGLVIKLENNVNEAEDKDSKVKKDNRMMLYYSHRPYHPLIDGRLD